MSSGGRELGRRRRVQIQIRRMERAVIRTLRPRRTIRDGPHTLAIEMSNPNPQPLAERSLELPVQTLLERARPLPPHEEMVIEELTPDEGAEFLATLKA